MGTASDNDGAAGPSHTKETSRDRLHVPKIGAGSFVLRVMQFAPANGKGYIRLYRALYSRVLGRT